MWIPAIIAAVTFFYSVSSQTPPECVCVPYYQCTPNGTVITDGEGILDERLGDCTCTCQGLDVCCALLKDNATITTREPTTDTSVSCGYSNPDGVGGKIGVEGSEALFGEYPWMVQVFEDGKYRCGGSLIHPSVVLTAAHCINKSGRKYTIRVGEWDTTKSTEFLKHQDRTVSSVKFHENFKAKVYYNDVGLLFLDQAVELRPHINLVCLPPKGGVRTNSRCFATGWGKPVFAPNQTDSSILKKVDLLLVQRSECQNLLRKTRLGAYFNLHESFICAGGEKDKDTCTGDGGGPLFCPIEGQNDRYQQVGITAWGLECNYEDQPGVYADVSSLRSWIDKEMKEKNLPVTQYQYR